MTVAQAHARAVSELAACGLDRFEAAITARLLVDRVAGLDYAHLKRPDFELCSGRQPLVFEDGLCKLCAGYPLAYLLGGREFHGLTFKCDERALIPRPDTERLVEAALALLKDQAAPLVADLGTGSGCIAISIAHALPQVTLHATDLSEDALSLARENADELGVSSRVQFFEGAAGEWALPLMRDGRPGKYDAILTNPPYISISDIAELQPQIRAHEPISALDGGDDGLDCYRAIAAQCGSLLNPRGFLMAELGAGQFEAAGEIFRFQGWHVGPPHLDLAGIERVLFATLPSTA